MPNNFAISSPGRDLRVAALDVDGTLCPTVLGDTFVRMLHDEGVCRPEDVARVESLMHAEWRDQPDFVATARRANLAYAAMLQGVRQETVVTYARQLAEAAQKELFPFVLPLLAELRRRGLTVILLSGSPDEVVSELARIIGAAAGYGAKMHVAEGVYSGQVSLASGVPGWKREMLRKFTSAHPAFDRPYYALGNSMFDMEVLELSTISMAFEPDLTLREAARSRSWPIVDRNSILPRTVAALSASAVWHTTQTTW